MSIQNTSLPSNDLWKSEVQQLETRVHELIQLCETLREENRGLRGKLQETRGERDQLLEKNQYAMRSVESILASVQVLEQQS